MQDSSTNKEADMGRIIGLEIKSEETDVKKEAPKKPVKKTKEKSDLNA